MQALPLHATQLFRFLHSVITTWQTIKFMKQQRCWNCLHGVILRMVEFQTSFVRHTSTQRLHEIYI